MNPTYEMCLHACMVLYMYVYRYEYLNAIEQF